MNSATEAYCLPQNLTKIESVKLNKIVINPEVPRDNVYQDLLKIYKKKRNVISHKFDIFQGEDALRDGVTRGVTLPFSQEFMPQ